MVEDERGLHDVVAAVRRSWRPGAAAAAALAVAAVGTIAARPAALSVSTIVGFAPRAASGAGADTLRLVVDRYTTLAASGPLAERAEQAAGLPAGALHGHVDAKAPPLTANVTVTVTSSDAHRAAAGADAVAAQLVAASGTDDVVVGQVLDPADPDAVTVRPRKGLLSVLAVAVALGLGLAVSLVVDKRRSRLPDPRASVRAATGAEVLGVLPWRRSLRRPGAVVADGTGAQVVRELALALPSGTGGPAPCVYAVLSCRPGDGRTTVALLLAQAAACRGSVLLVDADASRPALSYLLGLEDKPGLLQAVGSDRPLAPFIHRGPVPGVDVLGFGPGGEAPAGDALRRLALRSGYGAVVLDGPPLLGTDGTVGDDTRSVLEAADMAVLAARPGRSGAAPLRVAATLLAGARVPLAGSVLVATRPRLAS